MFRAVFLLFLAVFAFGYDELLLDAQASVVPKIAMLDKGIQNKLIGGKLVVAVVHDPDEADIAKEVVSKITANAKKNTVIPIKAVSVEFSQLAKSEMSMVYILASSGANVQKAVNIAKQKGIASFVYDKSDLAYGAMLTLNIERSAVITLKRSALKDSGVSFVDSFYKIVRVVE